MLIHRNCPPTRVRSGSSKKRRSAPLLFIVCFFTLAAPDPGEAIGAVYNITVPGNLVARYEFVAGEDLVLTSLGAHAERNTLDGPGTVSLLLNGVVTPLTVTYSPGQTGPATRAVSVHAQAGDVIELRMDGQQATTGSAPINVVIYSQPANAFAVPAVSPAGLLLLGGAIAGLALLRMRSVA